MTDAIKEDIHNSIEAMFYTPNYCDLYIHVNQVREMLGLDRVLLDEVIADNKWVIEQFRKYVGSHQIPFLGMDTYERMLEEIEKAIEKAEEANSSPKELLYMYLRDEWLSQVHAVVANAIEALDHIGEEDYDA